MKPVTTFYILFFIITALTSCEPNLKSRTDYAINISKSKFPNLGIQNANEYQMVRKLEIKLPQATIQLLEPTPENDGEGQMIVFSDAKNNCYAVPLPPTRYKTYWNFVYDTTPALKVVKTTTFEAEINKALDTLALNTGYNGLHVLTELFNSVLQARQISERDTSILKLPDIPGYSAPDSCIEMDNKTYQHLVAPMRKDKYWVDYLYSDHHSRIIQINFTFKVKEKKKYYYFGLYRQPCIVDVKPINL